MHKMAIMNSIIKDGNLGMVKFNHSSKSVSYKFLKKI